ncbi:DEAD/DEAH box helicase [Williamsoniiplasma lucivorax]|uniref:DEAD-box ATP-dependent RNA helicase n=1 Tax=Williamsoniiplasma lucivorax TaxID=209274 RepID=A0A2S5RDW2_9MOLU|nr:DEAD/DEAH box helicase [Williamsoniiplasma lucivorax]PPE05529.1 DEAD-box ATP-dependent RNA helicase [Williamsoniiplasma lucivorax]
MTFKNLGLNPSILRALDKSGFDKPTQIQQQGIPVFMDDKNLFGKSSTGTGKTASFALPILHKIDIKNKHAQAIILAPTRELALQILDQIRKFSSMMENISIAPLIGGARMNDQIKKLKNSQIIVGTPGRINDHINRKTLKLDQIKTIILDEADEMLKLGFKNDIDAVFRGVQNKVQIGLYSATTSPKVLEIAKKYMIDYELIEIENQIEVNQNIDNTYIITKGYTKEDVMVKLIEKHQMKRFIVFTNTRANTSKIAKVLQHAGIKNEVINGDKKQSQRTRVIREFKEGKFKALIATDVVARGIHIDDIDYVINFEVPVDDEYFVHRIGRTGRNNATGSTITFVNSQKLLKQLEYIVKNFNLEISEELIDDLGLVKSKEKEPVERNERFRPRRSFEGNTRSSSRGDRNGNSRSGSRNDRSRSSSFEGRRSFDGNAKSGSRNDRNRNSNSEGRRSFGENSSFEGRRNFEGKPSGEGRRNFEGKPSGEGRRNFEGKSSFGSSSRSNSWGDKKPATRENNSWGKDSSGKPRDAKKSRFQDTKTKSTWNREKGNDKFASTERKFRRKEV